VADERPNVLVIMSDQHHAGVMGCAGDPIAQTPHLDRLAGGGVRFAGAYCPFPLCGPSRMAFMACRHPFEIDLWTNETQLNSDVPTFAHAFLAAGYDTVLSGRMHFVGADQRHGFARRLIGDVPESSHLAAGWKLSRVLGELRDTPGCSLPGVLKSGPGRTGYHAYDEAVCDATVDWLRSRGAATRDRAEPFLLVAGIASPHCPFVAPPEDFYRYADLIRPDDLPPPDDALHPLLERWRKDTRVDPPPPIDAQWRTRVAYYGLCTFADRIVGRMLDALAESGLADNTIVVYTSDHGEMLGEHGLWWKSTFYEASARVPLLVRWPGRLAEGRRVPRNVSLIDVGATLLDLAGADPLPSASGRSLRPLLDGDETQWDDTVFAEHVTAGSADRAVVPQRMVRQGPWKYIYSHGMAPQLFDLDDDPGELRDRSADPACADICDRLRALVLRDWDPNFVARRLRRCREELRLVGQWVDKTQPPEPDPLWFDQPPVNEFDPVQPPAPGDGG